VSDSAATARVELRSWVAAGAGRDVFSPEFRAGRAARTLVAGVPTVIRCLPRSVFECIVPVSYADYVMRWLTHRCCSGLSDQS
jgi:sarcosine oxidase gamma subunit